MSFFQQLLAPLREQNDQADPNTSTLKTEGTTQTFGQAIVLPNESGNFQNNNNEIAKDMNLVLEGNAPEDQLFAIESEQTIQDVIEQNVAQQARDTIVVVVQEVDKLQESIDRLGDISLLPCKVKSNIAVAAAAANDNATVVLPESNIRTSAPTASVQASQNIDNLLFTSIASNFSIVAPNVEDRAVVLGSAVKTKEEIKKALTEAQKVDLTISLKSQESDSIEANYLKVPVLNAQLNYNYFVENEEDIEVQEDQAKDPLLKRRPIDTPRFVQLNWNTFRVTQPLTGTEKIVKVNEKMRVEAFDEKRGCAGFDSTNVPNSVEKSKKNFDPIVSDGLFQEVTDIHSLETAFESLANHQRFPNTIGTVLNVTNSVDSVNAIPYLELLED